LTDFYSISDVEGDMNWFLFTTPLRQLKH